MAGRGARLNECSVGNDADAPPPGSVRFGSPQLRPMADGRTLRRGNRPSLTEESSQYFLLGPEGDPAASGAGSAGSARDRNAVARRKLVTASVICGVFMLIEVIAGYVSNSLALVTDASHLLSDLSSFLISLFAIWISELPGTQAMSFGYHRAEILGAVISVILIWVLTVFLLGQAVRRIFAPPPVDGPIMFSVAFVGTLANVAMTAILGTHSHGIGGLGSAGDDCAAHAHGGRGHAGHQHAHGHGHGRGRGHGHGHGHAVSGHGGPGGGRHFRALHEVPRAPFGAPPYRKAVTLSPEAQFVPHPAEAAELSLDGRGAPAAAGGRTVTEGAAGGGLRDDCPAAGSGRAAGESTCTTAPAELSPVADSGDKVRRRSPVPTTSTSTAPPSEAWPGGLPHEAQHRRPAGMQQRHETSIYTGGGASLAEPALAPSPAGDAVGERYETTQEFPHHYAAPSGDVYITAPLGDEASAAADAEAARVADAEAARVADAEAAAAASSSSATANLNLRAAYVHALGDLIQNIGVLVAAGFIWYNPRWAIADPICTFVFSGLVCWTTLGIIREAVNVLMEGVPHDLSPVALRADLKSLRSVVEVHDLHVWSLSVGKPSLACHIVVDSEDQARRVLREATCLCQQKYGVLHTTIQIDFSANKIACGTDAHARCH